MSNKSYWFYLEPYAHISIKDNHILLYNTLNAKSLEYKGQAKITELINNLKSRGNLLVAPLLEKELCHPAISKFISQTRGGYFGDIIEASCSKGKPIELMPMLNIQKGIKILKNDPERSAGERIMEYLTEFSIYITNECGQNCSFCGDAYKQLLWCSKLEAPEQELDLAKIEKFAHETKASSLRRVNILGGNILRYSKLKELSALLDTMPAEKAYYLHYLNIDGKADLSLFKKKWHELNVLVSFPLEQGKFKNALGVLSKAGIKPKYVFMVQNDEEVKRAQAIASRFKIADYSLQPYYNGKNINFFKKNVFISKDEICQAKLTMRDIYGRMAFNPTNWGRVFILNNGDVHANIYQPKIGSLGRDSLYDIIYQEMKSGRSWRRLRTKTEPCKKCVFDVLCPPLSNYEYALKRNNLCNVWK